MVASVPCRCPRELIRSVGAGSLALAAGWILATSPVSAADSTFFVPMTDGALLRTDVWFPTDGGDSWPVMIERTPYGAGGSEVVWWTSRGYVAVAQDLRGTYQSQGEFGFFQDDGWGPVNQDGLDTVGWLLDRSWCDGNIATMGNSARGITQNLLAGALPPGVKCMHVDAAASDLYEHLVFPGGVFRRADILGWLIENGFEDEIDKIASHPTKDEYWDWVDVTARSSLIDIPTYQIGGWYDVMAAGNVELFSALQYGGAVGALGNQKLIVGPWDHNGDIHNYPAGALSVAEGLVGTSVEWHDHWAKALPTGIMDLPPIAYYLMGDRDTGPPGNEWRTTWAWPPAAVSTAYYFHADGTLSETVPVSGAAALSFAFDPLDPVPTVGGANLTLASGPLDQTPVESRSDVLLFTTPVLTEAVEVVGPIRVVLQASTDRLDTDFTAKLCDVYPDGRSLMVTDGILQTRYRISFAQVELVVPGQTYRLEIDLCGTALLFEEGHRIRVAISSSNYPRFEVNPNTGDPFWQNDTTLVATNSIHVDAIHPSHIVLPVTSAPGLDTRGRRVRPRRARRGIEPVRSGKRPGIGPEEKQSRSAVAPLDRRVFDRF